MCGREGNLGLYVNRKPFRLIRDGKVGGRGTGGAARCAFGLDSAFGSLIREGPRESRGREREREEDRDENPEEGEGSERGQMREAEKR